MQNEATFREILLPSWGELSILVHDVMNFLYYKNAAVAEFEKLSKYKDLEIEVEKLWHMKTVTIAVVIGALGMIKKGTEKHLEKIPESPNLGELRKITLTGTAHILRKTLNN